MAYLGESELNQYYKKKLEEGEQYQDFVTEKLYEIGLPIISYSSKKFQHEIGENKCGFEIKFDNNFRKTGNLYIEYSEKSDPCNENYILSGIYRKDNTWLYIIGDYQTIYILSKKQLQIVHKTPSIIKKFRIVETPTSKGILLPLEYVEKNLAIKVINI